MKHVTITNMTGARNSGCEALVSSIIAGIEATCGKGAVAISLDTQDPAYDCHIFAGRVRTVYGSARFPSSRWPRTVQSGFNQIVRHATRALRHRSLDAVANMATADLLVAAGGDVFTSDYGKLAKHARTLHSGAPVALLAQTIGPFSPSAERLFRASLKNVVLCTVRESETLAYLSDRFPDLSVEQTADVAFLLAATDRETARMIVEEEHHFAIAGRRLVGLAISGGVLAYRDGIDREHYFNETAAFVDTLNANGFSVILIPHVRERAIGNNDIYTCRAVLDRCASRSDNLLLALPTLTAADYKGVIALCEVLVGARTHATIASMSQGIPTVAIAYSRKAWGIMRDYYGRELGDRLTVDIAQLDRETLSAAFEAALANGRTPQIADEMKRRASTNFERIRDFLKIAPLEEAPQHGPI